MTLEIFIRPARGVQQAQVTPRRRTTALVAIALLGLCEPAPALAPASLVVAFDQVDRLPAAVVLEAAGFTRRIRVESHTLVLFPQLRPGSYSLEVEPEPDHEGTCRETALELRPGETLRVVLSADACRDAPAALSRHGVDRSKWVDAAQLERLPRPADPWSVARDVAGVTLDRVNVGGSETARQSLILAGGDSGSGTSWSVDGIDVTDPAAPGFTSLFPNMAGLAGLELRTSALDVRVRTPGAQVDLVLREPGDRLAGTLGVRAGGSLLQADNLPEELADRPFPRDRTDRVLELDAQAGGPLKPGRLWLWGGLHRYSLAQDTLTEHAESLRTSSLTAKLRLRLGDGHVSLTALRSEKVHEDRDTGFSSAPEARWKQSGPVQLWALEDRRALGGISLLSRVSYLDGGFRLEPAGGQDANVFEDGQGVLRGSYRSYETERGRLQTSVEAAGGGRALGLDHALVAGIGYRRAPVESRSAWPGNKVLALTRRGVYFRTFQLTGYAIATRDEQTRTVQDQLEAYVQDRARLGRLGITGGLRLDRLAGHGLAAAAAANPVFPDQLPAVSFAGAEREFRWLDVLPRAGLGWDVTADARWQAQLSYAAYAAPLASGEIAFDSPLPAASLSYFWIDRNGDETVQPDEIDTLRGLAGATGLDPDDPGAPWSPNRIDPDLRSPRTHELRGALEVALGPRFAASVGLVVRRNLRPLWAPLRGLTRADYAVTGAVRGELFGEPYSVAYYAPAAQSRIVEGNGRLLTNREGYRQDTYVAEVKAQGAVGEAFEWQAWAALSDWREHFDDPDRAIQDPTPLDRAPLMDAGVVAAYAGGLGRDAFVNARWSGGAALRARLGLGLSSALLIHARDGFPIPYYQVASTGDPTGGAKDVLIARRLDAYRLPRLLLVDARLERAFRVRGGRLTASVEAFNLLNRSTTLQVARDIELSSFNRPRELLRPRLLRIGLSYQF